MLTRLLDAAAAGDCRAAADLLPLVYDELRALAAARLAAEPAGHTLQPTALVHEAYLRLVGADPARPWNGCGHFFGAAAEAMRRILVENARRKARLKHGGGRRRVPLNDLPADAAPDDLIALDDALARFAELDPARAAVVTLRYFGGLTTPETATALGISVATVERYWAFARAWLAAEMNSENPSVG
jgi:RNA polymerase sigma factor (TIGR02999 family)